MACHGVRERRTYDFGSPTELADGWPGVAVFVVGYALALGLVWRYWLTGVAFVGSDA